MKKHSGSRGNSKPTISPTFIKLTNFIKYLTIIIIIMILLIYLYSISLELIGVFESITRNYSGQGGGSSRYNGFLRQVRMILIIIIIIILF